MQPDQESLASAHHQNVRPGTIGCYTKAAIFNPCPGSILSAFCWNANNEKGTRESRSSGLERANNFQNGSHINIKNSLEGNSHSAGERHWRAASLQVLRLPGKTLKPPSGSRCCLLPQTAVHSSLLQLTAGYQTCLLTSGHVNISVCSFTLSRLY